MPLARRSPADSFPVRWENLATLTVMHERAMQMPYLCVFAVGKQIVPEITLGEDETGFLGTATRK